MKDPMALPVPFDCAVILRPGLAALLIANNPRSMVLALSVEMANRIGHGNDILEPTYGRFSESACHVPTPLASVLRTSFAEAPVGMMNPAMRAVPATSSSAPGVL